MNTKRQTIWLVSMLSLMVVLSAYYLFTEDTPKAPEMAAEQQHLKGDATEATQLPQVEVTEVSVGEDAQAKAAENGMAAPEQGADPAVNVEGGQPEQGVAAPDATPEDKEQAMLDQVVAEGVMKRSTIEQKQMERNEHYQQELEKLMGMINDDKTTGDKLAQAYEDMNQLEEREVKISNLETELQKDYNSAVITQNDDRFTVVVQSNKMEVTEAVDIISKMMKELNITQDKVSVQYVSE
ncbi:SpoIIIAH-like family protein [Paenibacillus thiaminolyticus]|uniref:SpoIIIAH-like family protein n=1 Tax=Paenibacillus thiaminolyticus TaxID=49283 RepID=UPI0011629201|nr:SpoIIIAH-like family protein [Paenibacillus thiaminolyticus]NGP57046.1 SpoIIIAH-like family protein [Paenibacillus thiaminolyticus]WCR27759.1 SpoIIIAH-like family protein [Paenibacillus thiaminolyticus]